MAEGETTATPPPALSERFERSGGGQVVIAAGIVFVLLLEIGIHLPAGSTMDDRFGRVSNEYIRILGAEQAWGVFAPNPRGVSIGMEARVAFADGRTAVWTLPEGVPVGANLRYYRWRKWLERVRSDDYKSLWEPTARWVASLYEDESSAVVRVDLVRRFRRTSAVATPPPHEEAVYFTYVVPPDDA